MNRLRPLLIVGTRPEAIKMAPIIQACRNHDQIDPIVCFTGQHREMLDQIAQYFEIAADVDLDLMRTCQTLSEMTSRCLSGLDHVIADYSPDLIVAQGDTTSVLCASIAAFYRQLPFAHVEAGLRTNNLHAPWPEEFNRRVASLVSSIHFAPTESAAENLYAEGIPCENVHVTGNTVIDALMWTVERERESSRWAGKHEYLGERQMVLITGHRRENFGSGFESICRSIQVLAAEFPETAFLYPVHLNPNVREPVYRLLADFENVYLSEPASYPEFVWLMNRAHLIITDSGGVQEEAPSLRKPVIVMRDTTERREAVDVGAAQLVGTCQKKIVAAATNLLSNDSAYWNCQVAGNPYGDGSAAGRIIDVLTRSSLCFSRAA